MIWRSLICSSLLVCASHAATLTGTLLSGSVQLRDSRVEAVNKHKDYSGIIVSIRPVNQAPSAMPAKHVTMLQKSKMFTPHVLPVVAGSFVDFPNADLIFHNAFSS